MTYDQHRAGAKLIRARCAIVTLSDTRTADTDASGKLLAKILSQQHEVADYRVIPDDPAILGQALDSLLANPNIDAIITSGGTGVSPRDQTIGVVSERLETPLPGFGELFRMLSYEQIGSGAMLSRAIAGIARGKPLFALPGSPAAVELAATKLIVPELGHLLAQLAKNQKPAGS